MGSLIVRIMIMYRDDKKVNLLKLLKIKVLEKDIVICLVL